MMKKKMQESNPLMHSTQLFFLPCVSAPTSVTHIVTEVKFKPQHTEGADHSNVEPITAETVAKLEKPMVETTCQSSKPKSSSSSS